MKRIVKLRGELILAICISTVIGVIFAFCFSATYRNITIDENKLMKMAKDGNEEQWRAIKRRLEVEKKDETIVYENMKNIEGTIPGSHKIFIVDKEGFVKKSMREISIKQIDLSMGEGSNLNLSDNMFNATNIIKLNEENYVVYLNGDNIYDDTIIFQSAVIFIIIIFLIFIS